MHKKQASVIKRGYMINNNKTEAENEKWITKTRHK